MYSNFNFYWLICSPFILLLLVNHLTVHIPNNMLVIFCQQLTSLWEDYMVKLMEQLYSPLTMHLGQFIELKVSSETEWDFFQNHLSVL